MQRRIEVDGVGREFPDAAGGATRALDRVTFQVEPQEFVAIVGPSGCGKSTLLNLIAGLDRPTGGEIRYGGVPVLALNTRVGYITQKDSLLPWRNVHDNIALALRIRRRPAAEVEQEVRHFVRLVSLEGFERHYPAQLSGGMRRRVALARTLIYRPETLLMDEPFGALDAQLRLALQGELLKILAETKQTVVFVTHDIGEAVALADRVIVLSRRPAVVRASRVIPFARPRDVGRLRFSPEYVRLCEELWDDLGEVPGAEEPP